MQGSTIGQSRATAKFTAMCYFRSRSREMFAGKTLILDQAGVSHSCTIALEFSARRLGYAQHVSTNINTVNETNFTPRRRTSFYLFFFGNPCSALAALSPSASHLLAFTNCNTFRYCFATMKGDEIAATIQGPLLSILLARASSIAHALPGVANIVDAGLDGLPG